jgi:kanamycin kinase
MKRVEIRINADTFPEEIKAYLKKAKIYNSSCSEAAQVYYIEGRVKTFLKIEKAGRLLREKKMTEFFHTHGLGAEIIAYVTENGYDFLLTNAIDGEDGISGGNLNNPEKLAAVYGEALRIIHKLPSEQCPFQGRSAEIFQEVDKNIKQSDGDFNLIPEGKVKAWERMKKLQHLAHDDVVIHGDYCLPNIILKDYKLQGFVDLGYGGVGDRHWDLFWGIWTLKYNLKTDKYKNIFLDAYGRNEIDSERMELSRIIAGLTG